MAQSPYEIIGVDSKAQQDDIKLAYRKLAKKYHPDLNPGNKKFEDRFKEITAAYDLVGTAEDRAKYDRQEAEIAGQSGRSRANPFAHFNDDDLASIFGQMGRKRRPPVQEDETYQMTIDFRDSILGAERDINLPTGKKFRVKIPAGIESGMKLRFAGKSESGTDVYVQLNVEPSSMFTRTGADLESEVDVSLSEAILGGEIKVPTIDGTILLKIPENISYGQKMRVSGKGVPGKNGKRGAQIVKLNVVLPKKVDDQFKEAVVAWSTRARRHTLIGNFDEKLTRTSLSGHDDSRRHQRAVGTER